MKIKTLFDLGQIVATPGAIKALEQADVGPADLLSRHRSGDWGDIDPADIGLNELAIEDGSRIMSVYDVSKTVTVWIITEAGRAVTTILLPSEY